MRLLTHESGKIRREAALGLGVAALCQDADACDAASEHEKAARLMFAAMAVRGSAAGIEAQRAWASLKRLEAAGQGSAASRALERRVLNALVIATSGGVEFGTDLHAAMMERMKVLGGNQGEQHDDALEAARQAQGASSHGEAAGSLGEALARESAAPRSKEAMESGFGLGAVAMMAAFHLEGTASYTGEMTDATLREAHGHWGECAAHMARAAGVAPGVAETVMWGFHAGSQGWACRMHRLPDFHPEAAFGVGGERLRKTIEQYEHDAVHPIAKQMGFQTDVFMLGLEPLYLLLWWGDLKAMRDGVTKALHAHKSVLERVKQGAAPADGFGYESVISTFLTNALVTVGDYDGLKAFLAQSMTGEALRDDAVRAGVATYWASSFGGWQSDDGHCYHTFATWLLVQKGLSVLIETNTADSRAALREWLPSAAELLKMCDLEVAWRSNPWSDNHPAILLSRLRGERLGEWAPSSRSRKAC